MSPSARDSLAQTIATRGEDWGGVQLVDRVPWVVHRRREHLQRNALKLGQRIYDQTSTNFVASLEGRKKAGKSHLRASVR
jgi:hypothetical protein